MPRRTPIPFLALGLALCALLVGLGWWLGARESAAPTRLQPTAPAHGAASAPTPIEAPAPELEAVRDPLPARSRPSPGAQVPGVAGRVRERAGEGIEGAALALVARVAGEERILARTTSAADGAFSFAAARRPGLHAGEGAGAQFHVAARAQGFLPARGRSFSASPPRLEPEELLLDRGATLLGRCVDGAGEPVAGAQLLLLTGTSFEGVHFGVPSDAAGAERSWVYAEACSDEEGRFALPLPVETPADLLARHPERGAARRGLPSRTDLEGDLDLGDIPLAGGGFLAGHVRHADGTPAAAYEVVAVPAAWARERPSLGAAEMRARAAEGGAVEGRLLGRSTSGADGAFRIGGLLPGSYALFHPGARLGQGAPWPIAATGRADIVLGAPHPRVVVEVSSAGLPAPGARVLLENLAPISGTRIPFPSPQQTETDGEGRASFDLAPEAHFALLATLPGCDPAEAELRLEPGQVERALRLELAPAAAPARLSARLIDARDGSLLPSLAELRSRATGLVRLRQGFLEQQEVPPGAYRLELRPRAGLDETLRFDLPEVVALELDLAPGEELRVELPARQGGRVRLFLDAPPPPAGPELVPPAELDERELARWRREALFSAGFQARSTGPDGSRTTLLFPAERGQSGTRFLPDPAGILAQTVLAPGLHDLELESPAFREVRARVSIEAGEVRDVHVRLIPR